MTPMQSLFFHPTTQRWRSGWRVLFFFTVLALPRLVMSLFAKQAADDSATMFVIDWAMIAVYAVMIAWVVFVSALCLHWLDGLSWRALGYQLHQAWLRDVWIGLSLGVVMIALVVALQMLGGATRVQWQGWHAISGLLAATILLWLAAA